MDLPADRTVAALLKGAGFDAREARLLLAAASGIGNFGKLLAYNAHNAPLRRNINIEEVGNAAAFLLSDLASGITGEIMYVDGGLNTTALGNADPLP